MGDEEEERVCSSGLFCNIKPCVGTAAITLAVTAFPVVVVRLRGV